MRNVWSGLLLAAAVVVTPAAAVELAAKQVVHKGNGAEVETLDPHKARGVPASNILRDLYEGLTSEAPNGDVIPGAAERWEISEDGTEYTFYLRKNARWSNGDPVTAADFVAGLRRSVDPATLSEYSQMLAPILHAEDVISGKKSPEELAVEAVDTHVLKVVLKGPTPYFLGLLNHSTTYPIHSPSFVQHGDRFARPGNLVSNGAYSLAEWVVQSHIRLERNAKYWDDANTTINEVYYYATEDQASELKRYRAGEIDYTYELPYNQLRWIRENLEDELVISPYLGIYYFDYNVTRPPFKDNKALRLALNLAIDRDIITEIVTGAGEIPAYSIVPPGVWNYEPQMPEWAHWTQEQRLAEARRLYAEAGYGPDDHLHVELRYNTHQNHKKISVAIAAMWKQALGVRTNLVNQEWKVFLVVRQQKRVTEVARDAWIGDFNDAFTFAEIFHSTSGMNNAGYASPVFDELLAKASVESDLAKRRAMLEEAERVMMEDLPVIPVYYYVTKRLVKPYLDGFEPNVMDHHYTKNWRILAH